jgi:hypothetical protein
LEDGKILMVILLQIPSVLAHLIVDGMDTVIFDAAAAVRMALNQNTQ